MVRSLTVAFVAALAVTSSFALTASACSDGSKHPKHHRGRHSKHHAKSHPKTHHAKAHPSKDSYQPSSSSVAAPANVPKANNDAAKKPSYNDGPSGPKSYGWNHVKTVQGDGFFDYFKFETTYSGDGGQGGFAQYTGLDEAKSKGMASVKDGVCYLGVDGSNSGGARNSIRVSSNELYDAGTLLVIDTEHMPTGCGTWPALWTVAQDGDWPGKGELDIVEGVNEFTSNANSAHTKSGFDMVPNGFTSEFMLTTDQKTNCDADATDDQGCGLRDPNLASFGSGFNDKKGGVWVLEWTDDHISMYLFDRDSLPQDIASKKPQPGSAGWGTPRAVFKGASGQRTSDFFKQHVVVANTNLCGKWVDGVWGSANPQAGQDKSCKAITGFDSCEEYVKSGSFKTDEAHWAFNYIDVYQL